VVPFVGGSSGHARVWRGMVAGSLALAVVMAFAPIASAATLTNAWKAKIGSAGVNGSATLSLYLSGTGSVALKIAKLKPSTSLAVTLLKTSCSGKTLLTLASLKTSSAGAATRTSALTVAQVNLIKAATIGTARIAIRVGSSTTAKCGVFAVQPIPAYLAAKINVGPDSFGVAISPTAVWVSSYYNSTLARVDPVTNSILSSIQFGASQEVAAPDRMLYAEGSLWVSSVEYDPTAFTVSGHSIRRIDPASGQELAKVTFGKYIYNMATSPGAVWVVTYDDGVVSRIDTTTNTVSATLTLAPGLEDVAYGEGSIWVTNDTTGTVTRIDPATNTTIATVATVGRPQGVVDAGGAIWVSNWGTEGQPDGLLSRIDPATNQVVRTIPVGTNPNWIAASGGSVWVSLYHQAAIVRVSTATNAVLSKIVVNPTPVTFTDGTGVGIADIDATSHAVWTLQVIPITDAAPALPAVLYRINY
jgi:YVTN family beta-propeller protein